MKWSKIGFVFDLQFMWLLITCVCHGWWHGVSARKTIDILEDELDKEIVRLRRKREWYEKINS